MNTLAQAPRPADPFADLESDLDGGVDGPVKLERHEPDAFLGATKSVAKLARFPCRKCGGSGRYGGVQYHVGHNDCFTCKGTGLQKTDPVAAAKRRAAKEEKRLADLARHIAAWNEAHPIEAQWIVDNYKTFDFASSLRNALARWGSLTENQTAAIRRCIEKRTATEKARAERKPDADVGGAGFARMIAAFEAAKISGLKRPKFRVEGYEFSPAKMTSANAGSIYVTCNGTYVGKISATGGFFASREATELHKADVARIGADPLAAAVMHGKQTGNCSCCGRHLENEESVQLGIGPICRGKWGL